MKARLWVWLDRAAVGGLVAGLGLYLLPWTGALAAAFFATLAFILFHAVTSHAR
jgi:hypothetical protein